MSRRRPAIRPDVSAELTAAIPPRLVKKLDADPALAERWTWTEAAITTDKGEVVSLVITDEVVVAVACSCLLGPRCLHVAAVVAVLEPAELAAAEPAAAATAEPASPAATLAPDALAAAARAFRACADVLAAGAESTGAFAQAELLRAIHACRTEGLHRLAAAMTRVLRSIRDLRADVAEVSLEVLTADLREALAVAAALVAGDAEPELVGRARRDHEPIGHVRLHGVFTEAVVARSGYAGAITYLADERGRLFTRADVAPGDAARAAGAYDASTALGDAVLPHRELGRAGLFVTDATASRDGRLGAGREVRAVRAREPSRWDAAPIAARFHEPLAEQLARIAAADATPEAQRPAGWDLVFLEGTLVAGRGAVALDVGGTFVRLGTTRDHRALAAHDNLAALARAAGLALRVIGRARLAAPGELDLLALGPAPGEARLELPEAWLGRANLHYDRLSLPPPASHPAASAIPPPDAAPDLLAPLRRRVERAVLGGAGTLPTHALAELEREAAGLAERALRTGAELLRDLAAFAHDATRTTTGARTPLDHATFARAWLRAALYEDAARRRLSVATWGSS